MVSKKPVYSYKKKDGRKKQQLVRKTPEEKLKAIRQCIKKMEEALDRIEFDSDQTYILRMAVADITAIAGPPSEEMGRRKHAKNTKAALGCVLHATRTSRSNKEHV
jgi:hypothetical protein